MSKKSGLADSPFFTTPRPEPKPAPPPDVSPIQQPDPPEPSSDSPKAPEAKTAKEESIQESKHENMQASKQESMLANKQTNLQENKHESMQAILQTYLNEKVDDIATFRYPVELLEKLEDVIHQVRKEHHRKVTKQAVAVAALAFLLTDFESFGEESMLYKLLVNPDE